MDLIPEEKEETLEQIQQATDKLIDAIKNRVCDVCGFKKCVCEYSWRFFDDIVKSSKYIADNFEVSPIIVSTMTVNAEIDSYIDLEKLNSSISKSPIPKIFSIMFKKGTKKSNETSINNNFYNQCEIKLNIGTHKVYEKKKNEFVFRVIEKQLNIKVAIFCNGKIKFVGCRSLKNIIEVLHILQDMFDNNADCFYEKVSDEKTKGDRKIVKKVSAEILRRRKKSKDFLIKGVRISMLNATFYVNKGVKRRDLERLLNCGRYNDVKEAIFDTENHEAVRIKYLTLPDGKDITTRKKTIKKEGELTIMIFNTGSIILTGASSIINILKAYEFMCRVLSENSYLLSEDQESLF